MNAMRILQAVLFALAMSSFACASNDLELEASVERAREISEQAGQIALSHGWGGVYSLAIGMGGDHLSITADGDYARVKAGCFGVESVEFGHAAFDGSALTFTPEGRLGVAEKRSIIRWGDVRYLVNAEQGRAFVDWVNGLGLPSTTDPKAMMPMAGYSREQPTAKPPAQGTPLELPLELRALLREAPAETRLLAFLDDANTLTWKRDQAKIRARVDGGRANGLFVGMSLYGMDPFSRRAWMGEVVEATERDAVVAIEVDRFDDTDSPDVPPAGLLFTSRAHSEQEANGPESRATLIALDESFNELTWSADHDALTHGTIDRGSADGVRAGMLFFPTESGVRARLKVEGVVEHRSRVKVLIYKYSGDEQLKDEEKPMPGLRLEGR